jgi:hypothetical protein
MSEAPPEHTYERFKRLMPRSQDLTVILLKGHLLIEEILRAYLEGLTAHPTLLKDIRLTFYQCLRLVQAMSVAQPDDPLWQLIEATNTLRNELSHRAEVDHLDLKADRLNRFFGDADFTASKTARERATRLRNTFAIALGLLSGRLEGHFVTMRHGTGRHSLAQS